MVYKMKPPRCNECGKVSVNDLCIKCSHKIKHKKQIEVKCSVCGRNSTTTNEKWLNEPYKCMKCR